MKTKKVIIIGAGVTGLLACRHCMAKGFDPVVFEAEHDLGGIWSKTLESTRLQTPKQYYQFSDFDWPPSVKETFPNYNQVLEYLRSYASHFKILSKIKFNTSVTEIDYCGPSDLEDFESWDLWGGTGEPFSQGGKWNVTIQQNSYSPPVTEVYQADFVILCIGNFSGLTNVPEFEKGKGPEVFKGVVIHAMDFAAMEDKSAAAQLITGKRVTVVGSSKSALDLAVEIAAQNGSDKACTVLFREAHWMIPESFTAFTFKGFNRFTELMIHKPHQRFFQWLCAIFLSPLLWTFSKMVETYLKLVYPMKKYNMVPSHSFVQDMFSCGTAVTPIDFYDKVKQGSLVLKKAKRFSFCKNGVVLDGNDDDDEKFLETDIVIFATGYKTDEKLKKMFSSEYFQNCIIGSSAPFYRECIHPRIPNVAMPGYSDSPANIYTTEMKCKWLSHFLFGNFNLPSISDMENDIIMWEKCKRRYAASKYKRHCCFPLLLIHFNDQLCYDMGYKPFRKSSFFADLFSPYTPRDYNF